MTDTGVVTNAVTDQPASPPLAPAGRRTWRFRGPVSHGPGQTPGPGPGRSAPTPLGDPHALHSSQLLRLLTRRLFGYPASGWHRASGPLPAPDLAAELPTVDNGGLSPDLCTYRIRLRRGPLWDAQQARPVTPADVIRGLKRVAYPVGRRGRHYLTATIEGMAEYCAAYEATFGGHVPQAPDLAQFQMAHQVAGLSTVGDDILEIRLRQPANDFLHILATGFAAAVPREYDYYVPESHELYRNNPSCGPYRVLRRRSLGRALVLEPNPRWSADHDPIRTRAADLIEVGVDGVAGPLDPATGFTLAAWRPQDSVPGVPTVVTYLVCNPRAAGPVRAAPVRAAIDHALDRRQIASAGSRAPGTTARPLAGVLTPGSPGHREQHTDPDPHRARHLLRTAGFPDGVRLAFQDSGNGHGPVGQAVAASLARAGIVVEPAKRPDGWDIRLLHWAPDWYGNNGRAVVGGVLAAAELPPRCRGEVDDLLAAALRETEPDRLDQRWEAVDREIRRTAWIIGLSATTCPCCVPLRDAGPVVRWVP